MKLQILRGASSESAPGARRNATEGATAADDARARRRGQPAAHAPAGARLTAPSYPATRSAACVRVRVILTTRRRAAAARIGGSGQCSTAQTVRSSSPSSTESFLVVRDAADQALDEHLLGERPQVREARQRVAERLGPCAICAERRPMLWQHHGDAGFVGACVRAHRRRCPAPPGWRTACGWRPISCSSEALPCSGPASSSSSRLEASSRVRQHSNTSMRAVGVREPRDHVAQLLALARVTAGAAPETAAAWPAGAAPAPANRRVPALPSTSRGELARHTRSRGCALRGEHLGNLAGQHHQHERARVVGGVDEIAQAFGDRGARALGVAHVFAGDGAGQRGDAVRRVTADAAVSGAARMRRSPASGANAGEAACGESDCALPLASRARLRPRAPASSAARNDGSSALSRSSSGGCVANSRGRPAANNMCATSSASGVTRREPELDARDLEQRAGEARPDCA